MMPITKGEKNVIIGDPHNLLIWVTLYYTYGGKNMENFTKQTNEGL
jgi:hypothetical protein